MNTAAAAQQANVTPATIRTWCRRNVIAAAKIAGRWVIDTASLLHRIALGRKATTMTTIEYTVDTMTAIGGSRWTRNGKDRVYLNDWAELAGLQVDRYNSGNIGAATYKGKTISNSQAVKLLNCLDKVWFDAETGKLHHQIGRNESRVATREQVWADVVAGVRAAIAAL